MPAPLITATANGSGGTVAKGTVSVGETLIIWAIDYDGNSTFAISGFTQRYTTGVIGGCCVKQFERKIDGSEGSTFTISPFNSYGGWIRGKLSGEDPTTPFDTSSTTGGTSATPGATAITTAAADEVLFWVVGSYDARPTTASGWTAIAGAGDSITLLWKNQASAGSTGAISGSLTGSDNWVSGLSAFKPAGGGGGGTAYTATHSGSITTTGLIKKDVTAKKVGSTTGTGRAIKALALTRTGSTTATGLIKKDSIFKRIGSITAVGLITKAITKVLTGSSTPSGTADLIKTPGGGGGGTAYTMSAGGSITATGKATKAVAITRTGSTTGTARLYFQYGKRFTGAVTATGLASKAVAIRRLGSSTPTGLIRKQREKLFAGAITATGRIVKALAKTFAGSVTPFGLLTSPDFPVVTDEVIPPVRTYYPGTDTPTRLALFDLDRLRREGDAATDESLTALDDRVTALEPVLGYGFHVTRTSSDAAIPHLVTADITFNNVVEATWSSFAGFTSGQFLTVPSDGAGLYVFEAGIYSGGVGFPAVYVSAVINGAKNAAVALPVNSDRWYAHGVERLKAGDFVHLRVSNNSGSPLTPTFYPGDPNTPTTPFLRAWRIGS